MADDKHEQAGLDHHEVLDEAATVERNIVRSEAAVAEAKRHVAVRVFIVVAGSLVLLLGLALLALPGPGLVVVALGLGMLATEVPFARRLLDRVTDRVPKDANRRLPKSAIVMMVVTCVVATSLSLWWAFLRG